MKKNVFKNICITTITALVALGIFSSCGKEDDKYGDIKDVDLSKVVQQETVAEEDTDLDEDLFNNTESTLKYEFTTLHLGRTELDLPYPKTWDVHKASDYNLYFQAPFDDPHFPGERIWFHTTNEMELSMLNELENTYSHLSERERFLGKIQSDEFIVDGGRYKVSAGTDIDERIANTDIIDADYQYERSYRDWDVITIPQRNGLYHHSQTFLWGKVPCILSGMTTNKNADKLNELVRYMMSNATSSSDYFAEVENYRVFGEDDPEVFKMCPIFTPVRTGLNDLSGTFDKVSQFACPMDSGTGYSQTTLTFYKLPKKKWPDKITEQFFHDYCEEPFISNAIGYDNYMKSEIYGYLEKTKDKVEFDGVKSDQYRYVFSIEGLEKEGFFERQHWRMIIHTFEHKDNKYIMVTCYPENAVNYGLETFATAAATFKFTEE